MVGNADFVPERPYPPGVSKPPAPAAYASPVQPRPYQPSAIAALQMTSGATAKQFSADFNADFE